MKPRKHALPSVETAVGSLTAGRAARWSCDATTSGSWVRIPIPLLFAGPWWLENRDDGRLEIVAGGHDPFKPYRSRCRLFVYKAADERGQAWKRFQFDDRFEHHDGAQIIELSPGRLAIISHAWQDKAYVHLWEPSDGGTR